jgi:hypothetical protein
MVFLHPQTGRATQVLYGEKERPNDLNETHKFVHKRDFLGSEFHSKPFSR